MAAPRAKLASSIGVDFRVGGGSGGVGFEARRLSIPFSSTFQFPLSFLLFFFSICPAPRAAVFLPSVDAL